MDYLSSGKSKCTLGNGLQAIHIIMWTAGQGSHHILDPYFELLLGPSLDDGVATNLSREKGQLLWDASVCQPLKPII